MTRQASSILQMSFITDQRHKAACRALAELLEDSDFPLSVQSVQSLVCFASSSPTVCAARRSYRQTATRLIVPELKLQFGERIKAVGDSDELGTW